MNRAAGAVLAAAAMAAPAAAAASETVTYSYDPLGRLVGAATAGSVNDGLSVSTSYDPAGNRSSYAVSGAGAAAGLAGGMEPDGLAGADGIDGAPDPNRPPVARDDEGLIARCGPGAFTVLGNDYDPDGNLPLTLLDVSSGGGAGTASISGSRILYAPGAVGTATVAYVVSDALGATASATLSITILDEPCEG